MFKSKTMSTVKCLVVALWLCGCGINVVEICSPANCSTGWYDGSGNVVTTKHGHDGAMTVRSVNGFTENDISFLSNVAYDVAVYSVKTTNQSKVCYRSASVGTRVVISTLSGVVIGRVLAVGSDTYRIDAEVENGDSGAPVTRRGCVIGVVRARSPKGVLVVRIRKREK